MSIETRIDKLERAAGGADQRRVVVCWLCDATPSEAEERIEAAHAEAKDGTVILKVVWADEP